jgi:hypothetical protein
MKLKFTLLLLTISLLSNAQSFKILDNPTLGKNYAENDEGEYETLNFKVVDKLDLEITAKKKKYQDLLDSIDFGTGSLADKTIKEKQEELDAIKSEIKSLEERRKLYRNEYVKEYLNYSNFTFGFWNERSHAFSEILYDTKGKTFNLINNSGFNIGSNSGSVYTELVSGQLYIFRVSLGTLVSSSSDEDIETATIDEAYQRLVTTGGNTVLKFEYPLLYSHASNNQWTIISRLIGKGTADFAEFGTKTDDWAGSGSFGLDIYADVATSNNNIRFYMNYNINKIFGTNSYIDNLGIENSDFSFGQLKLGLVFNKNISLSFVVATFSSEDSLRNRNVIAGGQILR